MAGGPKPKRRRGFTRLSSKRELTIPITVLAATGVSPGDVLKIETDDDGRIILSPAETGAERASGSSQDR